ncbi:MAG TPA: hypothetical protein VFB06_35735, partial [Streptosporangiaceae bacterium]|nr:hypothetical protein [Streptosporangiaceae bacterium]
MAICPDGHDSLSDDYCDICGMRIGAAPSATAAGSAAPATGSSAPAAGSSGSVSASASASGSASGSGSGSGSGSAEACPQCGSPKSPGAFCEVCGFNYATGTPTAPPP